MGWKDWLSHQEEAVFSEDEARAAVTKFADEWEKLEEGDYSATGIDKKRGFTSEDTFTVIKGVSTFNNQPFTRVTRNNTHLLSHEKATDRINGDDHTLINSYDPKTKLRRPIEIKNGFFKENTDPTQVVRIITNAPKASEMVRKRKG